MSENLKKKKFDIPKSENIMLEVGKEIITIRPYLTISEQALLIKQYVDALYKKDTDVSHNYLMAEYCLIMDIINICTNIDLEGLEIEDIINGGLWEKIKKNIFSYNSLRYKIDEITKRIDANESLGNVVNNLVEKANVFLNKLLEIDISKWNMEEINKMLEQLQSAKKDLDNTIFDKENESLPLDTKKKAKS